MRSSDDAIRMPLNVAPEDAEQSASMGAVYPEHVAFACRDIEGVARRAAQRGLDRLPVPANYYADLQARCADAYDQLVDRAWWAPWSVVTADDTGPGALDPTAAAMVDAWLAPRGSSVP